MKKDLKKSLKAVTSDVLKTAYDANEKNLKKHLSDSHFRKVRKLANNPELFVKDSVAKRKEQVRKYLPIKYNGHFQYTVVSAVYNVEKYLDEYFESLVNQSLSFKKHIHLILVDDGSTDGSAEIIKKWQEKYPKNIHYYYKENGGQASARNLGLQYVQTDWVTFIDPDDFVDGNYFLKVDESLSSNNDLLLVSCPFIFYFEEEKVYKDTHPLKYRFSKLDNIITLENMGKNMQLSVNSAFFKTENLKNKNIIFHEEVKPNFEDAKFVGDYFASLNQDSKVAFISNTSYFYRKRSDGTSTLDGAWKKPGLYSDVLSKGCLLMLKNAKDTLGYVPVYMQRTVLYHLAWYFKKLVNNESTLDILDNEQKQDFVNLVYQIFYYIDEKTIMEFELAGTWFFQKVAWLGCFKNKKPKSQICYIEEIDIAKKQILVVYYTYFDVLFNPQLNDKEIIPVYEKTTKNYLNKELFVQEKRYWLPFDNNQQSLSILIDNSLAEIKFKTINSKKVEIMKIIQEFSSTKYQSDNSWLLMDRETKADDNAEHLYRYLQTNHPEQQCYFALNRDSGDWDRLQAAGFNLVAFGESDFELRLANCSKIISSHIDAHIHNYFGDLYAGTKQFVFLQHGVIKDNLSRWLNGKKHVACFVTTTKDEYQSIAFGERYKFGQKEVVLTGLPRHDELYHKNLQHTDSKTILIMPTWRSYLMGKNIGKGVNTKELNPELLNSNYAVNWLSLLQSDELKNLVDKYEYQVIFAPHSNIEPYLPQINLPTYIKTWSASKSNTSIQDLFVQCSLMITDYSSVAFEMAYIDKTTLYYQFDKDEFFANHSYQKGYFDYEKHGFGAFTENKDELLSALEQVLQNDGKPLEPYATRIRETFPFRDGSNCERVYQAILDLDKPDDGVINVEILADMVDSAKLHFAWDLIESRRQKQLELGILSDDETQEAERDIVKSMYMQDKYAELVDFLSTTLLSEKDKEYWQIKLDFWLQKYDEVVSYFNYNQPTSNEDRILYLLAYAYTQDNVGFNKIISSIELDKLSDVETQMIQVATFILEQDNDGLVELLQNSLMDNDSAWTQDEFRVYKPQLILAKALIAKEDYKLCHYYLKQYNEKLDGDYASHLLFAQMGFAKPSYKGKVAYYESLTDMGINLTQADYIQYLIALCNIGKSDKLSDVNIETLVSDKGLLQAWTKLQVSQKQWQKLDEIFVAYPTLSQTMKYEYALTQTRLAKFDGLDASLPKPIYGDSYEYWQLMADIAMLNNNLELQQYCYKGMIAIFPENDKERNFTFLNNLG